MLLVRKLPTPTIAHKWGVVVKPIVIAWTLAVACRVAAAAAQRVCRVRVAVNRRLRQRQCALRPAQRLFQRRRPSSAARGPRGATLARAAPRATRSAKSDKLVRSARPRAPALPLALSIATAHLAQVAPTPLGRLKQDLVMRLVANQDYKRTSVASCPAAPLAQIAAKT